MFTLLRQIKVRHQVGLIKLSKLNVYQRIMYCIMSIMNNVPLFCQGSP